MNVLVIAEHNNDEILPATLNTVNAAKQIGTVDLFVIGNDCQDIIDSGNKIEGLNKIGFEILVYKKRNINSWFCNTIISNLDNIENNIDFIMSNLHWGTRWSLYNKFNI